MIGNQDMQRTLITQQMIHMLYSSFTRFPGIVPILSPLWQP